MSDKSYYHEMDKTVHLRVWALGQMVWGAFVAGAILVGIGAILAVLYFLGLLLPAESRETPSPYGAVVIEVTETIA
jgi:Intrinsic membrane protein PufX